MVSAGRIADLVPTDVAIVVTTPDAERLVAALQARRASAERIGERQVAVTDATAEIIGRTAIEAGVVILEMRSEGDDLETIFENLIHPKELAK